MKQGSTLFLKLVIALTGTLVLSILVIVLPSIIQAELKGDFDYAPLLFGLYIPAVPFFIALFKAVNILSLIEKNQAFSTASVKALKHIKYCGIFISSFFLLAQPYTFYLADLDDAPALALLGFVIIFAAAVIATAAGVFQRLLQNAVDLKSENDLTV